MAALQRAPGLKRRLLGLSLVSLWGVRRLGRFMGKRLPAERLVALRMRLVRSRWLGKW